MQSVKVITFLLTLLGLAFSGCEVMPVTRYKPTLHNPFVGNMQTVAVLPFYNYTDNPNVDGREFANYFALELQKIPGFKVIANKVVEDTMWEHDLGLHRIESVEDIRYLAQLLKVDAVVIGKIHGFNMNYSPYTKFETEWYSVNPYLHPIPIGYGLPWGTEYEHYIPDKIVLLSEMELAAAQIKTQTPKFEPVKPRQPEEIDSEEYGSEEFGNTGYELRQPQKVAQKSDIQLMAATIPNNMKVQSTDEMNLSDLSAHRQDLAMNRLLSSTGIPYVPEAQPVTEKEQKELFLQSTVEHPFQHGPWPSETAKQHQLPWSQQNGNAAYQQNMQNPPGYVGNYAWPAPPNGGALTVEQLTEYGVVAQPITPMPPMYPLMPGMPVAGQPGKVMGEPDQLPGLPSDWPDPRGLIPEGPKPERAVGKEKNDGPIISWINVYNGNDSEFMQALQDYDFLFRDDKRISSRHSVLTNRSEFISFCCRLHIWEIFSARGGAGPAEKVSRSWKPWEGGERPY